MMLRHAAYSIYKTGTLQPAECLAGSQTFAQDLFVFLLTVNEFLQH